MGAGGAGAVDIIPILKLIGNVSMRAFNEFQRALLNTSGIGRGHMSTDKNYGKNC